jgi:hypothetical protein
MERRDFLKVSGSGVDALSAASFQKVYSANDRIHIGLISRGEADSSDTETIDFLCAFEYNPAHCLASRGLFMAKRIGAHFDAVPFRGTIVSISCHCL